jgi:hypothetical protein
VNDDAPEGAGTVLANGSGDESWVPDSWTLLKYVFLVSAFLKFASMPHSENVAIVCLMADAASIAMKSPMSPFMGRYLGVVGEYNGKVWYRGYSSCLYIIGRLTTWMAWGWLGYTVFVIKRAMYSLGLLKMRPKRKRESTPPEDAELIDIPGFGSNSDDGHDDTAATTRTPPTTNDPSRLSQASNDRGIWTYTALKAAGKALPPAPDRFVAVCGGNERKGQKQFEAHLKWREVNDIDYIVTKPWEHFHVIKKYYPGFVHGRDRAGNVCYFEQLGKVDEKTLKDRGIGSNELLYHCNLNTEFIWNVLSPTEEARLVTVLDVSGVGVSMLSGRVISYIQMSSEMQFKHYPERSIRIFIVNAPRGFDWTWSYVKKVLPQALADKIKICSMSTTKEQLLEFMDEDQIPTEYCGDTPSESCVPLGQGPLEIQYRNHIEALNRGETVDVKIVIGLQGYLEQHNMVPTKSTHQPTEGATAGSAGNVNVEEHILKKMQTLQEHASGMAREQQEMKKRMEALDCETFELQQKRAEVECKIADIAAEKVRVEAKFVMGEKEALKLQHTLAALTGETVPSLQPAKKQRKSWFGKAKKEKIRSRQHSTELVVYRPPKDRKDRGRAVSVSGQPSSRWKSRLFKSKHETVPNKPVGADTMNNSSMLEGYSKSGISVERYSSIDGSSTLSFGNEDCHTETNRPGCACSLR